jgi:aryl-alcohol dehydrogenase-like predicted oxidoreductase
MDRHTRRPLGRTGLRVSPIGFGAFKIGRNQGARYPDHYALPHEADVERLLHGLLDLGINLIDTAPAYGLSQQRIGRHLAARRDDYVLATKVGERFENGQSRYDFSGPAVTASLEQSLRDLRTDVLDLVFIHSDGRDLEILNQTDVVAVLTDFKRQGKIRAIGLSGKTPQGAAAALTWADALEVPYNLDDRSHETAMRLAADAGVGVLVKKGLASGHLPPEDAIRFVLANPAVHSVLVGSLNLDHLAANLRVAEDALRHPTATDHPAP